MGAGLVALDIVIGGTHHGTKAGYYAGGTCANVLTILQLFGWASSPIGRIAHDAAGSIVEADLKRFGVSTDLLHLVPLAKTPIIIQKIRTTSAGTTAHSFSWYCPSCGRRFPGYQSVTRKTAEQLGAMAVSPAVLFFDRASPATVHLASLFARKGSLIVFEPSAIADSRSLKELLTYTHILKYSNERRRIIEQLQGESHQALIEIETLGAEGLRYRSRARGDKWVWRHRDAYSIGPAIDTAGAGDWLTAGLILGIGARGYVGVKQSSRAEIESALDLGQALAAWNCGYEGARGGMYCMDARTIRLAAKNIRNGGTAVRRQPAASLSNSTVNVCDKCVDLVKAPRASRSKDPYQALHG
jgi:fructokinase